MFISYLEKNRQSLNDHKTYLNKIENGEDKENYHNQEYNKTGIELSLNGRWLDIMIELNYYIFTTSSTYYPNFENMFIGGYLPLPDAWLLCQYFTHKKSYNILLYDQVQQHILYLFNPTGPNTHIQHTLRCLYQYGTIDDNFPYLKEATNLFLEPGNHLVYITIEDGNSKNRDLYDILLKYFNEVGE
jgi:hypothetical protein